MTNSEERIIVTGGSGFIGSEIINVLSSANYDVLNIDIQKSNSMIPTELVSICDLEPLRNIFHDFQPSYVVHCAGDMADGYKKHYFEAKTTQIIGTANIVNVSKECGCKKIVFLSSDHVYVGLPEDEVVDENTNLKLDIQIDHLDFHKLFALSKFISEKLCLNGFENSIIFRIPSIYGRGECSNLIFGMISESKNKGAITIWGDGTRRVQFTDISDIAEAVLCSLQIKPGIYNIVNQERIEARTVAELIGKHFGVPFSLDKGKPEGPRFPFESSEKFLNQAKEFSFTPFAKGLGNILEGLE